MIGKIGLPELGVILLIMVLIFGANRVPKLASSVGESIRNFKRSMREAKDE